MRLGSFKADADGQNIGLGHGHDEAVPLLVRGDVLEVTAADIGLLRANKRRMQDAASELVESRVVWLCCADLERAKDAAGSKNWCIIAASSITAAVVDGILHAQLERRR